MKKLLLSFLAFLLISLVKGQALFSEPFNYTTGDLNSQGGWNYAQGGTSFFQVVSPGLTFTGYPLSGSDNAVAVVGNASDIEQENSDIGSTVSSGSLYCSFLLNVTDAPTTETFILGFGTSTTSQTFLGSRLYLQKSTINNTFSLGINPGLGNTSSGNTGLVNDLGTTYLIVLKYTFVAGIDNNELSLFVIPTGNSIPASEPSATIGPLAVAASSGEDMDDIDRISLIARDVAVDAKIDGIRVADSWSNLFSAPTAVTKSSTVSLISVYPNPCDDQLHFSKPVSAELMTMDGQIVFRKEETEVMEVSPFPGRFLHAEMHFRG